DADRQWFKARYGLDAPQTPRDVSFCGHVVAAEAPLIVPDALGDERFADNPFVTGEPHVRFYAGFPLATPDGFVLGTLCAIDHAPVAITDRQRALLQRLAAVVVDRLELRRRSRLLDARTIELETRQKFFELSLDLLCTADDTLHFRELNPAWERTLGWTLEELRARPFIEFVHPDDLQRTIDEASRLLKDSAITVAFENRYQHKDGHWVPLSWVSAVSGGVFYAAAHDLTAQREKAEALAASEQRLRGIVDHAVDAFVTINARGLIEHANPAVEKLFGYVPSELLGQNVNVLMPSPDREAHDGYLANYLRTGHAKVIGIGREVTALRKDGTTFPAELAVSEFHVEGAPHFTGIVRDISERKRVEKLKSEFVSTVSHELRTPLTSIRGALGLVAGGVTGELPAEASEYVKIALSNSNRLVRLINDILDLEKVQSGRMEFRFQVAGLRAAVESAIASNLSLAADHRVRLALAPNPAAGDVLVDPDRLAQVLTNLISNAVKFSPPDSEVELSVTRRGDWLRVGVLDRGPGIPAEFRPRIFERFAQADASNTRQRGGTGLGLSISRSLVERMRGSIGFADAAGGGTMFFVDLPFVPPVDGYAQPTEAGGTRGNVLVCEDDPEVARGLAQLVQQAGLTAHLAPTLERARQLLERHRYLAVTLDLRLPDGDGTALIHEIRSTPRIDRLPIIVVSAFAGRVADSAVEVSDVLEKPFAPARLSAALDAAAHRADGIPRVLHVEDDPDVRQVVRRLLPPSWTVRSADTVTEARRLLDAETFDCVLLDLCLPDGRGEELLGHLGGAQVVIFSAAETSGELASRVAAAMVKTKATADQLVQTLVRVVRGAAPQPTGAAPQPTGTVAQPTGTAPQPTGTAPSLAADLDALRAGFVARLPAKLDDLERAIAKARLDLREAEGARMLAHRLRGTAGSYGVPAVGAAVARVEDLLAHVHEEVSEAAWNEIEAALQATRRTLGPHETREP
ncbi:MAG: PAS domain S-box protein, partial [Deltaproteobacteria bacterium]|nr:PAS domain S-box protein [Deltaproteobacteria bacterium]